MAYDLSLGRLPDPTTPIKGPGFKTQQILPNDPGMIHQLNSGASIGVRFPGGNFWEIELSYGALTIAQAKPLKNFLYSLQGGFKNFYVSLPIEAYPATGQWDTNTGATNSIRTTSLSNSIDIINWDTISAGGNNLSPGDLIKLSNSNKIYAITSTNYGTASLGTLTVVLNCDVLNPNSIPAASLEGSILKFRVKLVGGVPAFRLNSNGLYEPITLSLKENIL